jgi:peptidoglycan DL-endopeptidase LytE
VKKQPDKKEGTLVKIFYTFIVSLFITVFVTGSADANTTYVIKKGDNPHTIAKKFKVSSKDILSINHINPHSLKPGVKLTIPSKKRASQDRKGSAKKHAKKLSYKNRTAENPYEDTSFHIVRKGDTLHAISRKYSISVYDLKEINGLDSSKLRLGQKLSVKRAVPEDYTVKNGDTIWNIAKRFDLDPQELLDLNGLDTDSVTPGQKLFLKPDTEPAEPKTYDTILSQSHSEKDVGNISEPASLNELSMQQRLILFAKKLLNIPYKFGGNGLLGIDCSAYVKKVYGLVGIDLPRSARAQFTEGKPVDEGDLSSGDLVFFRTYASFPSHVGIYLGNNLFIHASSRSKRVTIDSLETPYYWKRFIGAKRLIEGQNDKDNNSNQG